MTEQSNQELAALVRDNYAARARGELPDEWFWADEELLRRGYTVDDTGALSAISDAPHG